MHAGEEGVAPRRAALLGLVVCEDRAFVPVAVEARRFPDHQTAVIDARLHPADVVAHDEENVRLLLLLRGCRHARCHDGTRCQHPEPAVSGHDHICFLGNGCPRRAGSCAQLQSRPKFRRDDMKTFGYGWNPALTMHAFYTSAPCISSHSPPPPGNCRCASAMHLRIAASRASPCCAVCVAACGLASITATSVPSRPSENFLVILMACFLNSGCPNRAGSRRPVTITPSGRRDRMQSVLRREIRKPLHALDGWRVHPDCSSFLRSDSGFHARILHRRRYGGAITGP